jgi:anti-sigma factor RsiW
MADEIRTCADLDERLTPYVDGEDAPSAHRAVDTHLAGCPSCTGKARDEVGAREIIRERRDALGARAPEALRARCRQTAAGSHLPTAALRASAGKPASASRMPASVLRRWAPLSVAATLVLAVAGVFVFGLDNRVQALAASLAVDHVKCFKVNGTTADVDAHASELKWAQNRGWTIVVPQSEASQQLKLVGVRHCLSSDGHVAHMMYTWHGEPLSLYVLKEDAGRDGIVRQMGAQEVLWRANQRTYVVVSGDEARDLSSIVDYMKVRVQ